MSCTTLSSIKQRALFIFAFAIFNSTIYQFNFLTIQLINSSTLQLFNSSSTKLSRALFPYNLNFLYIKHIAPLNIFNPSSLWDIWALVSWGGSPIRDLAPFLTWT